MRSIAHDLGQALGCGAHLRDLRRLASGEFRSSRPAPSRSSRRWRPKGAWSKPSCPAARLLPEFPAVYVDDLVVNQIRQGRNFPVSPFRTQQGGRYVKAVSRAGELVAIGEAVLPNLYHPVVVL